LGQKAHISFVSFDVWLVATKKKVSKRGKTWDKKKESSKHKFPTEKRGEKRKIALDIRVCVNTLDFFYSFLISY
jgi:hypothetical protein